MNPLGELTPQTTAAYLRTLPAIRDRCSRVHELATQGKLLYFDYHPEKEADVAAFCLNIIKVCPHIMVLPPLHLILLDRGIIIQIQRMYVVLPILGMRRLRTHTDDTDPTTWPLAPSRCWSLPNRTSSRHLVVSKNRRERKVPEASRPLPCLRSS